MSRRGRLLCFPIMTLLNNMNIGSLVAAVIVYVFLGVFIGISQSAGVGGGPIINITLMIAFGYTVKESMAMTYIFLFGGALSSVVSNIGKRDEVTQRLLMEYDLILLTVPMMLSGSIFGTLLNHLLSQLILTVCFTALLSYLSYTFFIKCISPLPEPLLSVEMRDLSGKVTDPRLQAIINQENRVYPPEKLKILLQVLGYSVVLLFCMGGRSFPSLLGLEPCSFGVYLCLLLHLVLSYFYCKSVAMKIYQLEAEKESLGFVIPPDRLRMSESFCRKIMLLGFSAGTIGGALGLGGAIVLVPVWIAMKISGKTAVSSTGLLILSSAMLSSTVALFAGSYSSVGMVGLNCLAGFIASHYVRHSIDYIAKKYELKKMTFILFTMVMMLSLVVMVPFEFLKYAQDPVDYTTFGELC